MHLSRLDELESFTTLDGSTIREIAGPAWTPARNQSLAEATVPAGAATIAHFHREAEELYLLHRRPGADAPGRRGARRRRRRLRRHPAGSVHELRNTGDVPLVLLCCCAPAYSDADTVLLGDRPGA